MSGDVDINPVDLQRPRETLRDVVYLCIDPSSILTGQRAKSSLPIRPTTASFPAASAIRSAISWIRVSPSWWPKVRPTSRTVGALITARPIVWPVDSAIRFWAGGKLLSVRSTGQRIEPRLIGYPFFPVRMSPIIWLKLGGQILHLVPSCDGHLFFIVPIAHPACGVCQLADGRTMLAPSEMRPGARW